MDDIRFEAYHGSVEWKASKIKCDGFIVSKKDCEWLGEGVYFYAQKSHAIVWAKRECEKKSNCGLNPAVVTVSVHCKNNEYLDLDDEQNMLAMIDCFHDYFKGIETGRPKFESDYQLRCFCCNLFRKINPQYKIFAYTFGFPPKRNAIGFHVVRQEKQYCVANNDYIDIGEVEVYKNVI